MYTVTDLNIPQDPYPREVGNLMGLEHGEPAGLDTVEVGAQSVSSSHK